MPRQYRLVQVADSRLKVPIFNGIGDHSTLALIKSAHKILWESRASIVLDWHWCAQCAGFHLGNGVALVEADVLSVKTGGATQTVAGAVKYIDRAHRLT